jgi:hypothetical protein
MRSMTGWLRATVCVALVDGQLAVTPQPPPFRLLPAASIVSGTGGCAPGS